MAQNEEGRGKEWLWKGEVTASEICTSDSWTLGAGLLSLLSREQQMPPYCEFARGKEQLSLSDVSGVAAWEGQLLEGNSEGRPSSSQVTVRSA